MPRSSHDRSPVVLSCLFSFSCFILIVFAVVDRLISTITSSMPEKGKFSIGENRRIFGKTLRRFLERYQERYGDCAAYSLECARPFSWTQTAICARELKPNLDKMLLTWASTVRFPTTSRSAMSRLDFPCAMSV